jgi:hypothetical protein
MEQQREGDRMTLLGAAYMSPFGPSATSRHARDLVAIKNESGHRADLTSRPGLTQSEIGGGLELFPVNFVGGSKRSEFV